MGVMGGREREGKGREREGKEKEEGRRGSSEVVYVG